MSCIILKNNKESILHQKLIDIFGEETAKMKYFDFQSGTFLASFGDYLQYENIEDSALIEPNMRERLDENNEPKIFEDETGFYYRDSENNKSYFKTIDSGLYELFQSEEKIERLTEILSLDFIKRGAFNLDFDSLELSDLSSELSLDNSIFQKLGELSLELNSEVENIEYLMNGYSIDTILTDESLQKELKKKVIEYFKNRQLNYTEDFSEENEEEDTPELERDHNFSKSSFEINTKDKISSNIRMRLSLMVDTSKRDELFGQPIGFSFHEVYNKMSHLLSNNVAVVKNGEVEDLFETYKNIIRENAGSEKIPYLTDVYNMFDKISSIDAKTEEQKTLLHQLKSEIVRAFNLHSNIFNTSESSFEKVSKEEEFNYELEEWVTVKEASTNVKYEVFDVSKVGNNKKDILNSWNSSIENYFFSKNEKDKNILLPEKKQALDEILKGIKKIKESKIPSTQKVQQAVKLLNRVGINVSEVALNFALNDLSFRNYSEKTENYHNQKREQFFNDVSKIFESLVVNKDRGSYVNAYMMTQLAEAELFMKEDGSESAIHTANKTKWLFSNPSYLSTQITSWKKDRDTLLDFYQNSGKWTQGSNHLKWLLALDIKDLEERVKISKERLDELKLSHFNVYQTNDKYKDNKTISKQEYIADTINKMLYSIKNKNKGSIFRTTTAPGKSTQFEISHNNFISSNITSEDENILIPNSVVKIFWDYFIDEVNRMQEAYDLIQSGDKSKLVVYYHTDKNGNTHKEGKLVGNAFISQVLPNLDKSSFLNEYGFIDINKVQTDTIKRQIVNEIKNSVKEKVQKTFDALFENNVIEKINENNYNTRQLDSTIFNNYKGDNKTANKSIIYNIAGDLFLNSFINHIEYSKMFAGDSAYYKNDVDYIKRISATYTDGIYAYLNKDNKDFKIGVVSSVEYVEPYYNQLKELFKEDPKLIADWAEKVNAADAQAWITPKRWKDILVSTAKWSPKHDIIYKKLTGKIKEPLEPNELKKVAQPLKGVYFNLVNGRPVYLKYSQAVLIPDILQNTELKQLEEYMRHHNVDELLTFDAIKAGSPIPTTIHTSEGKLSVKNEDGSFKELNTLDLPSSGWKLQQDLPTKTFKETEIGSQIQKNILLLINDMFANPDKTFLHNDQEYSAEEIIKMTDSAFGELSKQGLQKIYKEFNISPDGTIKNKDKFYDAIVQEYIKKGGNDSTIKALKAGLSTYAMPGVKRKLDNIFMSIMNDRTLKLKTNGGAFIQMSNFGISKNEAVDKGVKFSPIVEQGETVKPYTYLKNANGEIIKDKLGRPKIQPNQILIPGSFIAKYIPNYKDIDSEVLFGKLNPETGQLEGGMIDNRILENIIGYRIPNQGSSSNDALMIAGILPEGMGDTVVAFTGITLKTGSDFDIDKMYVMFPNYNPRTNLKSEAYKFFRNKFKGETIKDTIQNLRSVFPEIEDEKIAEVLQSNETRVEFVRNAFDELVKYVLDNKSKSEVKDIINELDIKITGLSYISSDSNSEKALQNRIIELYKSMLLHPDNINKVMTPLDHIHIKNDAINLSNKAQIKNLDNFDFIKDIETKYSFMAGMAGVGQLANASVDYAMGSITDYSIKGLYQYDSSGKDIFKNEGKANPKLDMINSVTLSDKDLTDYFTEFSKNASAKEIEELRQNLENFKTIPISDSLSALMNAFVDIAKDPYITNINWNTMTTNTGVMLIRMGVHPFYVNALMAQPIIKEYIEFTSYYESNKKEDQTLKTTDVFFRNKVSKNLKNITFKTTSGNEINAKFLYDVLTNRDISLSSTNINNALKQVLNDELDIKLAKDETLDEESLKALNTYHGAYFNTDKFSNVLDYDLKNLRGQVFEPTEVVQQNVIKTFLTFQGKAKKSIKPFVEASKHGVNGVGKDSTQLLMALNRIQNISKNGVIGYNNKMYYNDGTPKLLGHYYENNLLGVAKIIQANPTLFISANQNIWNTYNIISQQIYGESLNNQELADKLEKTFYSYLMSGFGPFNLNGSEINNIVNEFPSELLEFKTTLSENENYFILNQLQSKIVKPAGVKRLKLYIPNKKNSSEYDNKMMNSFKDLLKYHPEIAKKLIQYSFFTSGFNLGADTFYQYIPPTFFIENGFNEYVKEYNRNLNKEDLNFIDQFYLANLSDRQIVRNIYINPKSDKVDMTSYEGVILLDSNHEKYQTGKYFVRTTETTDQYGQKKNVETYYKMLGYLNGKVVLSNNIPSQLGYGRISTININDRGYRQVRFSQNFPILPTSEKMQAKLKPQFEEIMNNIEFEQIEVEQVETENIQETMSKTPTFDTLPNKSNTPTMTYAGIGSRETPTEIQEEMTELAKMLEAKGYILRSGGAKGADTAFEKGVKSKKEIFNGFEKTGETEILVAHEIHPNLKGAMEGARKRADSEGRNGEKAAWAVQNLMARNTNQVFGKDLNTPVDFVIAYDSSGWIGEGKRPQKGGTLQAIDMASRKGIPVINLANSNWKDKLNSILEGKPEVNNIEVVDKYSIEDVKSNPNKIYIFGDNLQRTGTGGQAVIRNNENAFGIVTKLKPTRNDDAYMSDDNIDMNKQNIDSDINKIKNDGRTIVFPKDGLGTGLAKLKEKAPQTYNYLKQRILEEFQFNNDTGEIVLNKPQQLSLFESTPESIINIKKEALKTLFDKNNNDDIYKGSVVEYKDKKWIVWNISDNNRAQLIDTEGNKFSGTPDINKLKSTGTYKTTMFNGTDYIVTSNENIYSLDTGKQVFTSLDNSTKTQKERIISQILDENNLSENVLNQINKEFGTNKVLEYIKKCKS